VVAAHSPDDPGGDALRQKARPRGWQFIDLAELGRNTGRSYGAALLWIVPPIAVLLALALGLFPLVNSQVPGSLAPIVGVLAQYCLIIVAGGAALRGVVREHRRPWRSLIAPDLAIDWRRLAVGGVVELAILGGQLALVHALTGWPWRFSISAGLPLLLLAVLLTPLQAASEEVLFRGYLTQALGRIVRSRVLIALTVGLVFGLLHLNAHGLLTVPYFFVLSLIFSLVSLRDERLELVIGGHTAMNSFAFVAANSGLVGAAIGSIEEGAVPFNWAAIVALIVHGALFYGLTRLLVRVFCKPRSYRAR
jgi:membrane protease YdiL (CAAX protease family)